MDQTKIFTDGASRGNPGPGGWAGILVVPTNASILVEEIGGREKHTTNNQMELTAAIKALSNIPNLQSSIQVFTDSSYLINGITKWVFGWQKNNWKTKTKQEVLNRKLWEKLSKLTKRKKIEWKYIGGHVGVAGNVRADEIATSFADGEKIKLYKGPIEKYGIDVLNFNTDSSKVLKKSKTSSRSKQPAYSYISSVKGKIKIHKTWADCEKRVKGVSGTRFKKSLSPENEREIVKEFQN